MKSTDFDALGEPSVKTKMSLDDALAELGYGRDDWPSIQEVTKRLCHLRFLLIFYPGIIFCDLLEQIQRTSIEISPR
jgi:hypothetical protein